MTNIDILKRKLSEVEKYSQILKPYRKKPKEIIKTDITIYGAVERYLYLLCQATIDLAEALLSYADLRSPGSYKEVFEILAEGDGLISRELSLKMQSMTGFRNILAHAYGKVDFQKLYIVLTKDIDDIKEFIKEVKKKINI